jgi:hypothetical protein
MSIPLATLGEKEIPNIGLFRANQIHLPQNRHRRDHPSMNGYGMKGHLSSARRDSDGIVTWNLVYVQRAGCGFAILVKSADTRSEVLRAASVRRRIQLPVASKGASAKIGTSVTALHDNSSFSINMTFTPRPTAKTIAAVRLFFWVGLFVFYAFTCNGALAWIADIVALACIAERVFEARDRITK